MDPLEIIKEERVFLHDISNHLLVAQGMGAYIDKVIKNNFDEDSKEAVRSQKVLVAIVKMIDAVKARRELLHEVSSD